jgi:DeoR/GlpR family transcriptional regulator of sugar metabolism
MKEIIYELIPEDRFITKNELMDLTGLDERTVRRYICAIRKEHSIISLSSGKGYKKSKSTDDMTQEEIKVEYEMVKHQIAESNSRIRELKKNMKSSIARLKVLEKYIQI